MQYAVANVGSTQYLGRIERPYMTVWRVGFFLAAHGPMALLMDSSGALATLHAFVVFMLAVWWGLNGRLHWVAYAGAYIAGSEVLWRMTGATVPWEFGKYALVAIFGFTLIRTDRLRPPLSAFLYLLLLLPSILIVLVEYNLVTAKDLISFNMSGPLALFVSAWFFRYVLLSASEARMLFVALMAPVVGILAIAFYGTITASPAQLVSGDSNYVTSGGYGPNQVSSMLGLAALFGFFCLISGRSGKLFKAGIIGLMAFFAFQSALTFSRSGLAMAFGAGAVAVFFLLRSSGARAAVGGATIIVLLLVTFIAIPRLDELTHGAFSERFTDLGTTGRAAVSAAEIEIWTEHPWLGVGPGGGSMIRETKWGDRVAAHTEYTRVFADHGIFGMVSMAFLFAVFALNILRMRDSKSRALIAALVVWTILFLAVNGFRLAAPAFLAGLTFASIWLNTDWTLQLRPHEDSVVSVPSSS